MVTDAMRELTIHFIVFYYILFFSFCYFCFEEKSQKPINEYNHYIENGGFCNAVLPNIG